MVIMIILLILCLPLILMLSLFTATNMVSIAVDVPVSGIEVAIEEIVELDLDKGESFDVEYLIYPTEATNQDVTFIFEKIEGEKRADFTVDGNRITPISGGWAKVIVETAEGAFRDSFIVFVKTKGVSAIESTPAKTDITVGETTAVSTKFSPPTVSNKSLSYRVAEGETVATVDASGNIRGIGIGTAKIEVTSLDNPEAKSTFEITVRSSGVLDFTHSGRSHTALQSPNGEFGAVINPGITLAGEPVIELFKADGTSADSVVAAAFDKDAGVVRYTLTDRTYIGSLEIRMTVTPTDGEPVTRSFFVTQVSEIEAKWSDEDSWYDNDDNFYMLSQEEKIKIDLEPAGADVTFKLHLEYTDTSGAKVTKDVELNAGEVYALEGGFISVEIVNTPDGAYLHARRIADSCFSDSEKLQTRINLSIIDMHDTTKQIDLREIVVEVL